MWVVDGYPEYHHADCGELEGLEAEPIPYDQAVEDGFQPCVVCNPDIEFAGQPVAPVSAPVLAATIRQVWVVDGYPEYHVEDCTDLVGLSPEPVPYDQAIEDGFEPCTVCTPDAAIAADLAAPVPAARG